MLWRPEPVQIFVFLGPSRSDLGESLPTINLGVYLGELAGKTPTDGGRNLLVMGEDKRKKPSAGHGTR